jgi:hypothetical protein
LLHATEQCFALSGAGLRVSCSWTVCPQLASYPHPASTYVRLPSSSRIDDHPHRIDGHPLSLARPFSRHPELYRAAACRRHPSSHYFVLPSSLAATLALLPSLSFTPSPQSTASRCSTQNGEAPTSTAARCRHSTCSRLSE